MSKPRPGQWRANGGSVEQADRRRSQSRLLLVASCLKSLAWKMASGFRLVTSLARGGGGEVKSQTRILVVFSCCLLVDFGVCLSVYCSLFLGWVILFLLFLFFFCSLFYCCLLVWLLVVAINLYLWFLKFCVLVSCVRSYVCMNGWVYTLCTPHVPLLYTSRTPTTLYSPPVWNSNRLNT